MLLTFVARYSFIIELGPLITYRTANHRKNLYAVPCCNLSDNDYISFEIMKPNKTPTYSPVYLSLDGVDLGIEQLLNILE